MSRKISFEQERVYKGTNRPIRRGEVVNEVFKTNDYSIFKLSKFNRNVIFRKEMLEQAVEGFISPIVVNEEMIVIDGQNRLLHAKEAKVPIEYIIKEGLDENDIVRMNTIQKPWSLENYIEAFANQGLEQYELLIDLINQRLSSVTNIIQIGNNGTSNTKSLNERVKKGEYKFYNYGKTVEFLHYYQTFREETKTRKLARVETALFAMFRVKKVDMQRVIKKVIQLGINEELQVKSPNHTEALKMLLDAYNDRYNEKSNNYIKYHITSNGAIVIDEELHDWAEKKTTSAKQSLSSGYCNTHYFPLYNNNNIKGSDNK